MDSKPSYKLVGAPCGHHGQYTFYKAIRLTGEGDQIVAIGDFFFVRIWQDSELVSIGELQLLWTDRVSDQTLVSLRLYFLPENTPDGRNQHGKDEVLAINDKVVVRAEDLLSWVYSGAEWRWGLRAVWRGACAPPVEACATSPLHHTKLDFSDVESEKNSIAVDTEAPGVVVFSYPRYCRYRALMARLEGIQGDWLRDSLVAALGGYAAPTANTRILYCKDTFEYPELEGHEFVCNHLAVRLKGRPRGRRRRAPRSRSQSHSSRSSDSDHLPEPAPSQPPTPRRLSLRNGAEKHSEEEEYTKREETAEDKAFLQQLKQFYRDRNEPFKTGHTLKDLSLRALYHGVSSRGGYDAVCRHKLWRTLFADQPARSRRHYERFLLAYEKHEQRNGSRLANGPRAEPRAEPHAHTIHVADSPQPYLPDTEAGRASPAGEPSAPAEQLNREFLAATDTALDDKPAQITVKPVDQLIEPTALSKLFEENSGLIGELAAKHRVAETGRVLAELGRNELSHGSSMFLAELAQRLDLAPTHATPKDEAPPAAPAPRPAHVVNGHAPDQKSSRPGGRSSLRNVRVKPARQHPPHAHTPPSPAGGSSSAGPAGVAGSIHGAPRPTNFGIHRPHTASDDEVQEVPYRPKTPEIIDLDEYPESPQAVKKKKLDILKERGLEVTPLPPAPWPQPLPLIPNQMLLNPLNPMQHPLMSQAQLFQMYNILPPNYNGAIPPKVIQATSAFGSSGPEKTVYGNPKDPFMPPPHILHGAPLKPQRVQTTTPPQDILDLTCKSLTQKPTVEIVRVATAPSPSKTTPSPQNLSKNYTLIDGKAVVGSNLEITLVNKAQTPPKNRPPQKRSSNGKFVSTKTPTPPKDYNKYPHTPPNPQKKNPITVPTYQISREDISPTSSTGSRDSQTNQIHQNPFKNQNLNQLMDFQKNPLPMSSLLDPYMALYNLTGQVDQRHLAAYRDLMTNQFRGYSGLLNMGTPTTKN